MRKENNMSVEKPGKIPLERVLDHFEQMRQFDLNDLAIGKKLEVSTRNTQYVIERREDGLYISGNPRICPEPRKVNIAGSKLSQESSAIKSHTIVEGGYMEYTLPGESPDVLKPYTTSEIQLFEEIE